MCVQHAKRKEKRGKRKEKKKEKERKKRKGKKNERKKKRKKIKRKTVGVKAIFTLFPLEINGYGRGNAFRVNIVVQECFS